MAAPWRRFVQVARWNGSPPQATTGVVSANATQAQFANCRDWRGGTREQRYATIEVIRGQLTPQSSSTAESDLSDDAAYAVFQHACKADFTDKLRLYKLYAHAQAFAVLSEAR